MKILAIDVDYKDDKAVVAGVLFNTWLSSVAETILLSKLENISAYVPGEFYKRELPCILKLLESNDSLPDCIIVDGYVFLDGHSKAGLGKYLYDELNQKVIVIGVAKKAFDNISDDYAIYRGASKKPLYVTVAGMDIMQAKELIMAMHGDFRIPTLLKLADQQCRNNWS